MKMPGFSLAVVSLWSCAMPVYAQEQTAEPAQAISAKDAQSMQTVTVSARRFHMEPREFMSFEYEYSLENRETVRFSRRVGRFYVEIKGNPRVEIFPTSFGEFVTREGAKLVFTDGADTLTIDHYELLHTASGLPLAALPAAPE